MNNKMNIEMDIYILIYFIAKLTFSFNFNFNLVESWDSFIPTWSSHPHPPLKVDFQNFPTSTTTSTWVEISINFVLSNYYPSPNPIVVELNFNL